MSALKGKGFTKVREGGRQRSHPRIERLRPRLAAYQGYNRFAVLWIWHSTIQLAVSLLSCIVPDIDPFFPTGLRRERAASTRSSPLTCDEYANPFLARVLGLTLRFIGRL
jgi:hypothetical protein